MRRVIAALVTAIIAASMAAAAPPGQAPSVAASSAILMDAETGQVLYERSADQRRPMASTTKIMTALVILERGNLDALCSASKKAAETPTSSIELKPGEQLAVRDLLTAALVKSANDACVAAAETVAGSEPAFVQMMNERARELGAVNTHFANTNGLYDPQHYSSARDLALITRQAFRIPQFCRLVRTRRATIPGPGQDGQRVLISKNRLLTMMPGADGVKTGYVKESGHCLVASATRGGWRLIAVLLDSPDLWQDAPALLEYGFDNFRALQFARRGKPAMVVKVRGGVRDEVALVPSRTLMLVLPKWSDNQYTPRVELTRSRFDAPVRAGQKMGRMTLTAGSRELTSVDLLAEDTVRRSLMCNLRCGTQWLLFSLVVAAMVVRSYSVATKKHRTRRIPVRLTPAQQARRSSASSH